jgi:hypothetical protein
MALSPLEEFRLLKEGKPLPKKEGIVKKSVERTEAFHPNESPVDVDSRNEGTGVPQPKKPGQPCEHPKDRISTGHGHLAGTVKVCLDCGGIVNDRDLQT